MADRDNTSAPDVYGPPLPDDYGASKTIRDIGKDPGSGSYLQGAFDGILDTVGNAAQTGACAMNPTCSGQLLLGAGAKGLQSYLDASLDPGGLGERALVDAQQTIATLTGDDHYRAGYVGIGVAVTVGGSVAGAVSAVRSVGVAAVGGGTIGAEAISPELANPFLKFRLGDDVEVAGRPYVSSPSLLRSILESGTRGADAKGKVGTTRIEMPGHFAGSEGIYELIIKGEDLISHFLFRSH